MAQVYLTGNIMESIKNVSVFGGSVLLEGFNMEMKHSYLERRQDGDWSRLVRNHMSRKGEKYFKW